MGNIPQTSLLIVCVTKKAYRNTATLGYVPRTQHIIWLHIKLSTLAAFIDRYFESRKPLYKHTCAGLHTGINTHFKRMCNIWKHANTSGSINWFYQVALLIWLHMRVGIRVAAFCASQQWIDNTLSPNKAVVAVIMHQTILIWPWPVNHIGFMASNLSSGSGLKPKRLN